MTRPTARTDLDARLAALTAATGRRAWGLLRHGAGHLVVEEDPDVPHGVSV